jgi:hypothetical protein
MAQSSRDVQAQDRTRTQAAEPKKANYITFILFAAGDRIKPVDARG